MALSPALNTREFDKFKDVSGETTVRVSLANALITEAYDYVAIAYPSGTQEVYTFKTGGSGGTTVATVTLTYTDATKETFRPWRKLKCC